MSEFVYPPVASVTLTGAVSATITENDRQLAVKAIDTDTHFTYLDFGTGDQRYDVITFTSTVEGTVATATFVYTGSAGAYKLVDIVWS